MALYLDTDLMYVKGVGPKLGQILRKRGMYTVLDLLFFLPRHYEDRRSDRSIGNFQEGDNVSVIACVDSVRSIPMGRSQRRMYEVVVSDSTGSIFCRFFRMPYKGYFDSIQQLPQVRVSGRVTVYRGRKEFHHPDLQPHNPNEEIKSELLPLYVDIEGLSLLKIRKIISTALEGCYETYGEKKVEVDCVPLWVRKKYHLMPWLEAITCLHAPELDKAQEYIFRRSSAHKRLIFDEFFDLELTLAQRKNTFQQDKAPAMGKKSNLIEKVLGLLPFKLTHAQNKVIQEIISDLKLEKTYAPFGSRRCRFRENHCISIVCIACHR